MARDKNQRWQRGQVVAKIEKLTIRTKFRCDDEDSVVDELDENTSDSMVSKTKDDFAYGRCWPNPVINETRSDDGPQDGQYRKLKVSCRNRGSHKELLSSTNSLASFLMKRKRA
jgi:hypothetical protein